MASSQRRLSAAGNLVRRMMGWYRHFTTLSVYDTVCGTLKGNFTVPGCCNNGVSSVLTPPGRLHGAANRSAHILGADSRWVCLVVKHFAFIGIECKRFEPFRKPVRAKFSDAYWRSVWNDHMIGIEGVRDALQEDNGFLLAGLMSARHSRCPAATTVPAGARRSSFRPRRLRSAIGSGRPRRRGLGSVRYIRWAGGPD